jgi:hypothetical protein
MTNKSIKILLMVEDNPGDTRSLREMLKEQGSHNTDLTHVECMRDAEKHLASGQSTLCCSILGCPTHKDLWRYDAPARSLRGSPWWY